MSLSLRTRPWNRAPQQVYSLSTTRDGVINMNICTYVTPITMQPKQFVIGIYHNTQTYDNLKNTKEGLLQLLGTDQTSLITPLGKKSGSSYDKHTYLTKYHDLGFIQTFAYLEHSLAYIHIRIKTWLPESDHDILVAEVISWKNLRHGTPLTTTYLKDHKIIR